MHSGDVTCGKGHTCTTTEHCSDSLFQCKVSLASQTDSRPQKRESSGELHTQAISHRNSITGKMGRMTCQHKYLMSVMKLV